MGSFRSLRMSDSCDLKNQLMDQILFFRCNGRDNRHLINWIIDLYQYLNHYVLHPSYLMQ